MIEIFTPDEWRSLFPTPSMIIDDDQYIYRGEDRYKNSRTPIGYVDWNNGHIFGSDYIYNRSVRPIAYIIPDHNGVMAVYREKDTNGAGQPTFSAKAMFYIQNDTVYKTYPDWLSGGGGEYGRINETPPTTPSEKASLGVGDGCSSAIVIPLLIVLPGLLMFIIPENLTMILLVTGLIALGAVLIAGFQNGFVFEGRILGGIGGALIALFGVGFIWFLFDGLRGASGIAEPNEALEDVGFILITAAGFLANCIGDGTQKKAVKKNHPPVNKPAPAPKAQNVQPPKQPQRNPEPQKPKKQEPIVQKADPIPTKPEPKGYCIYTCIECGAKLRLPNMDCSIETTCPKCNTTFVLKIEPPKKS